MKGLTELGRRYEHLARPVPGHDAAFEPWTMAPGRSPLNVTDGDVRLHRMLRRPAVEQIEKLRAAGRKFYDGPVLTLNNLSPGLIYARRGRYLDMLGASEALAAEWKRGQTHLRKIAEHYADGDPLRNGQGRVSALAVSALLVCGDRFIMGLRQPHLAVEPSTWHVAPSGMLEADMRRPVQDTVMCELNEEVIGVDAGEADRFCVLGAGFDLRRLRAEVCGIIHVDTAHEHVTLTDDEYQRHRWFDFTEDGISEALSLSESLAPAAAATLTLAAYHFTSP